MGQRLLLPGYQAGSRARSNLQLPWLFHRTATSSYSVQVVPVVISTESPELLPSSSLPSGEAGVMTMSSVCWQLTAILPRPGKSSQGKRRQGNGYCLDTLHVDCTDSRSFPCRENDVRASRTFKRLPNVTLSPNRALAAAQKESFTLSIPSEILSIIILGRWGKGFPAHRHPQFRSRAIDGKPILPQHRDS